MSQDQNRPAPSKVSFILLPGFALTSFSLAIEALNVANQNSATELYRYAICSPEGASGERIASSTGVLIELTSSLQACKNSDLIFIAGYKNIACYTNDKLTQLLRQIHQRKGRIAALSNGAFVLANSGLLQGKSCTLTPEDLNTFRELYPSIPIQENLYTVTDHIFSSAGGTATLDLLFYLIGQDHGTDLVWRIMQQFMQERVRSRDELHSVHKQINLRIKSPSLGAAIELMQKHIATPYSISQLADRIGTTTRNLELVFQKYQHTTPSRFYQQLRLQQAEKLLTATPMSLSAIAQATGFSSQSHFGK